MAQDRQKQRNQLIHQALLAAVGRVEHSTKSDDIFAPIGELVFWIVAADGVLEKQQGYEDWRRHHQHGHLLFGIRYVRNKVAHESEAWDYESKDVYTDRYTDRYGSWTWVQLPRPGPKDRQHWHVQYAAYKTHLLGQPVIDTTMNAVDLLEDWGSRTASSRPDRRPLVPGGASSAAPALRAGCSRA